MALAVFLALTFARRSEAAYDATYWSGPLNVGPSARYLPAICYDSDRHVVVLLGGMAPNNGLFYADTWEWDGSWHARAVNAPDVDQRVGRGMAYDSFRHRCVLFLIDDYGGASTTWEFDGSSWTQVATGGPPSNASAAIAYDPVRHRTVLYDGGETWEWDGVAWSLVTSVFPAPALTTVTLNYDWARNTMVLEGVGNSSPTTFGYDGSTWTVLSWSGAFSLYLSAAYDSLRSQLVTTGGIGPGSTLAMRWDGSTWSSLNVANGQHTYALAGMVYYPPFDEFILFGGALANFTSFSNSTWIITHLNPVFWPQPISQTGVVGGSVTISTGVVNTINQTPQLAWIKDGVPLVDGGGISGSQTNALVLQPLAASMAGMYICQVRYTDPTFPPVLSLPATVTVTCPAPLAIGSEPQDATVPLGASATFAVSAGAGCGPVRFQWRRDGMPLAGATGPSYTIASVTAGDRGLYQALLSDDFGSVASRDATLNIPPGPVFTSFSAKATSNSTAIVSWTLRDPASVHAEFGGTTALGNSTAQAPSSTGGSITLNRGGRSRFYYRLVATDGLAQVAATPIREIVFPLVQPTLSIGVIPPVTYGPWTTQTNGIPVGIKVRDSSPYPVPGPLVLQSATLQGWPPRMPSGTTSVPVTIASGLDANSEVRLVPDLTFSKTEVNLPSGTNVRLNGVVRWYTSSAPNAAFRTVSFSSRFRLP